MAFVHLAQIAVLKLSKFSEMHSIAQTHAMPHTPPAL